MKLDNYSLFIFDWDGTLMDSTGKIVACMQETARVIGMPIPEENEVKGIIGLSMEKVIEDLFPTAPEDYRETIRDTYRSQYLEINKTPSPLFDGVIDLLELLKSRGKTVTVATGKARVGLSRVLKSVQMEDFFEHSICADEAQSKPAPEMVYELMKRTQFKPEETIVIGDSIHDIKMANNAAVDSIAVTSGANSYKELEIHKPERIFSMVTELTTFV